MKINFNNHRFQLEDTWVRRSLFLLILALGIILRLYQWNSYSFWYDEVNWLMTSPGKLLVSLKGAVAIFKPPLLRFLIYFWSYVGKDEFTLRLIPFVFSILSILYIYKVGKILFDEKIGLIAAFLLALSPFHIYYSQELTHYTLTTFLALCSIYYLFHSLEKNNIYSWGKFVIFTSLLLYSHYPSLFLVIAENLFFLFSYTRYKRLMKRWLLSQLTIMLLYSPWLMMIPTQFVALSFYSNYVNWIPKGSLAYIFQTLRIFNIGYNANFIVQFFALLLFFPLLLIGIFFNFKKDAQRAKLLILWLFIPMILSIMFFIITPTFTYRNFIFTLPAYYIFIASGMIKIKRHGYLPIIFYMILAALSLFNYYRNIFPYPEEFFRPGIHAKKDNREATKYIVSNFKEGDVVIHTSSSTILPYIYYLYIFGHSDRRKGLRDFMFSLYNQPSKEERLLYDLEPRFLVDREYKITKFIKVNNKRFWLIFSYWEPQKLALSPFMEENKVKKWFDDNLNGLEHKTFTGIDVYLYEKNI